MDPQTEQAKLSQGIDMIGPKIVAAFSRLSRKQKAIARFVLDNQEYVAFASTTDIATRTQSSPATVVRFCQAMGYEGYPHFQLDIREQTLLRRPAVQRFEERLAHPIPRDSVLGRVFETDARNIELTAVLSAKADWQAAVSKIRLARRILVLGEGLAGGLAQYLTHSLQVIGRPAQGVMGGGEPLALALAFLRPEDVIIGIGFWRNLRDVVEAIRQAREIGATTIGITDSRLSPLALLPDYPFLVVSDGVANSLSPVSAMSLLNALVASLSCDMAEGAVEALQSVDKAYERSGLLAE